MITEPLIWTYIVQLTSALRTIHAKDLAYRQMFPTNILVSGKSRYYFTNPEIEKKLLFYSYYLFYNHFINIINYYFSIRLNYPSISDMLTGSIEETVRYQQEDLIHLGRVKITFVYLHIY